MKLKKCPSKARTTAQVRSEGHVPSTQACIPAPEQNRQHDHEESMSSQVRRDREV